MSHRTLVASYVVWPVIVTVIRLRTRIRIRFLVISAGGWLAAIAIATTGRPADRALAVGLPVAGAGLIACLATAAAVIAALTIIEVR